MLTSHLRALARRYARALELPAKEFGAQSFRIGGATDIAERSDSGTELLLKAKGRWSSDIGRIYARMTRRAHLAASDLLHQARSRDLEELIPSFTQGT